MHTTAIATTTISSSRTVLIFVIRLNSEVC